MGRKNIGILLVGFGTYVRFSYAHMLIVGIF